jgi:hypothetical protein
LDYTSCTLSFDRNGLAVCLRLLEGKPNCRAAVVWAKHMMGVIAVMFYKTFHCFEYGFQGFYDVRNVTIILIVVVEHIFL